jgi:hypothetical protein
MSAEAHSLPSFPDPTFWNLSAPNWDAEFRAWAAPLLELSADQAGIMVVIIGQLIECAWRLRRINTALADGAKLADRDQCRALAEAQRAFSRAQADYQRWTREIARERERSGGARVSKAPHPASQARADCAPVPPAQVLAPQAESSPADGSTHTNNLVANEVPAAERRKALEQAALAAQRQANGPGWQPNRAQRRAMARLHRSR